jgi:hypothetical protein
MAANPVSSVIEIPAMVAGTIAAKKLLTTPAAILKGRMTDSL